MLDFGFNLIKCLYRADLWAFGCVIYQMLSGKSPFKAATDYLIFQKIKNLEYTMPDDFLPSAKDIVQRLLTSEPEKRFGSAATGGIGAIKEHPFFEGIDWDNVFTSNAPPLRERLEKEAKAHPIIPPSFDFGAQDDDDDDEEDLWLNNTSKINNGRVVSSAVTPGSALAGALAGALAQTTTVETIPQTEASNAPNPFYDHSNKIPPSTSSTSTPSTQPNEPLLTTRKVQHSRQSSSGSQLQPQTQHQLAQPPLNSNRSSHISSELSSSRNSTSPERLGNGGAGRTQPHLPW